MPIVSRQWFIICVLQALIALKKGSQLLKYGRKGKPKFCPFRLSNVSLILENLSRDTSSFCFTHFQFNCLWLKSQDETTLIWISSGGERSLKLASISKIIPGQRTVRFVFLFCICFFFSLLA